MNFFSVPNERVTVITSVVWNLCSPDCVPLYTAIDTMFTRVHQIERALRYVLPRTARNVEFDKNNLIFSTIWRKQKTSLKQSARRECSIALNRGVLNLRFSF